MGLAMLRSSVVDSVGCDLFEKVGVKVEGFNNIPMGVSNPSQKNDKNLLWDESDITKK